MVYGRYNELVHGGFVMVYKPTDITGGPHPVVFSRFIAKCLGARNFKKSWVYGGYNEVVSWFLGFLNQHSHNCAPPGGMSRLTGKNMSFIYICLKQLKRKSLNPRILQS